MMTPPDHRREAERLLAAGIDGGTWYQTHPADEAQARRDCVAAAHTHATLAVADAVAALGE
ncbi:MAG: hypothetical protein ACRDMV_14355, partial [Streptosporangiales bacterium]